MTAATEAQSVFTAVRPVWPIIQAYEYLDLKPISITVDLVNALSRQNIRINVPSSFTVGISTEPGIMQNAAERLLGSKWNRYRSLQRTSYSVS